MSRLVTLYNLGSKFICEEGLCSYPKHDTFSYRSYSVPDNFKMNLSNHLLFTNMFHKGKISNADGSIVRYRVMKKL